MTVEKNIIEKFEDVNKTIEKFSIYDLNAYTVVELYYKIATKLNEVITEMLRFEGSLSNEVVEQNKKLLYLLNDGLNLEVVKKIDSMIEDGSLNDIINNKIFNDLNTQVDKNNTSINELNSLSENKNKFFRRWKQDKFGFYSIDVIGDSIAEGYDTDDHAKHSFHSYLRNSLCSVYDSTNIGFVNLTNRPYYHNIEKVGNWTTNQDYESIGNQSYTSSEAGAELKLWVINNQKFFKICYEQGEGFGSFEVYNHENGQKLGTVNCNGSSVKNKATQEFYFDPEYGSQLVRIKVVGGKVKINGVWYYDDSSKLMVNNYSRSGMTLGECSNTLIDDIGTGNLTFMSLNHNDSDVSLFKKNLDLLSDKISNQKGYLFMLDFMWGQNTNSVKETMRAKYKELQNSLMGCTYVDIGKIYNYDVTMMMNEGFFVDDYSHPSKKGMQLIARIICSHLGINFVEIMPTFNGWNYINAPGSASFKNDTNPYRGYENKYRLNDGILQIKLALDSAYQGSDKYYFILPKGYRPPVDTRVCIQAIQDGETSTLHIGVDGKVYLISTVEQNHRFINVCCSI